MKDKPIKLIGLFHIHCLGYSEISDWLYEKGIPEYLIGKVIHAFNEVRYEEDPSLFNGTLMINPHTREAKFKSYWPQGCYLEDDDSESSLSRVISVVVNDYNGLKARASLLGLKGF